MLALAMPISGQPVRANPPQWKTAPCRCQRCCPRPILPPLPIIGYSVPHPPDITANPMTYRYRDETFRWGYFGAQPRPLSRASYHRTYRDEHVIWKFEGGR